MERRSKRLPTLLFAVTLLLQTSIAGGQGLMCRASGSSRWASIPVADTPGGAGVTLTLGRDVRAARLSDGSVALLDRTLSNLVVVDQSGRVFALANAGQAPGEISPGAVAPVITSGDIIGVVDLSNRRLSWFTRTGRFLGSIPYEPKGLPLLHIASRGTDVLEVYREIPSARSENPLITARVISADGTFKTIADTRFSDEAKEGLLFSPVGIGAASDSMTVVVASGRTADLRVMSIVGGRDSVVRLPIGSPETLTGDLARKILSLALHQVPIDGRSAVINRLIAQVGLAPTYPVFTRVVKRAAGGWLIQRTYSPKNEGDELPPPSFSIDDLGGNTWQFVSSAGQHQGECRSPSSWRVLGSGAGWVLFAEDVEEKTRFHTWMP